MAGVTFPPELQTAQTIQNTPVSSKAHNSQIETLEKRDQYMLDFLSTFDAIPIGTILPTTIPYSDDGSGLPDGWVWANGDELYAQNYPKLWDLIREYAVLDATINGRNYYSEWKEAHGFSGRNEMDIPHGFYIITNGSRDAIPTSTTRFRIPNLTTGIYIRGVGNRDESADRYLIGEYLDDEIKSHTHDITSYPTNGVDLSKPRTDIGVALTDSINNTYDNLQSGKYTSDTNNVEHERLSNTIKQITDPSLSQSVDLPNETRPKSVGLRYMLKVEFKNPFEDSGNVETNATTVDGYAPSIRSPFILGNIADRKFPIADPETGQLDPSWINAESLTVQVLEQAGDSIEGIVSERVKGILFGEDSTIEISPTTFPNGVATVSPAPNSIPLTSGDGKIDADYFNLASDDDIDVVMFA